MPDNSDVSFYLTYGRTMAAWARLERQLSDEFVRITKLPHPLGTEIFYSARSFQGRADMLAASIPFAKTVPAGKRYYHKAVLLARKYAEVRNTLAHDEHVLRIQIFADGRPSASKHTVGTKRSGLLVQEQLQTVMRNLITLRAAMLASWGKKKLLSDPELSLGLLDRLAPGALDHAKDQSAIDARISELAHLARKA